MAVHGVPGVIFAHGGAGVYVMVRMAAANVQRAVSDKRDAWKNGEEQQEERAESQLGLPSSWIAERRCHLIQEVEYILRILGDGGQVRVI